ncbi:MAG: Monooxygenase [Actinomycetota bacterium]|nr:Monooxygenase [Actinomycetota bacterium]
MSANLTARIAAGLATGALVAGCAAVTVSNGGDTHAPTVPGSTAGAQSGGTDHSGSPAQAGAAATHSAVAVPALVAGPGEQLLTLPLPGGSYTPNPPAGSTDDYRCFVLDLPATSSGFATGVQLVPGNPAVTHHGILYQAYPEQVAAAQELDDEDPGEGYQCFGGSQLPSRGNPISSLDDSDWLYAWAPGGKASGYPAGYGVPVPVGGKVVLQMHYNTRAGVEPDNTVVRLRMASAGADLKPITTSLLPAPVELPCAAGQSGPKCSRDAAMTSVVERFGSRSGALVAGLQLLCGGDPQNPDAGPTTSCTRTLSEPLKLFAVAGHMHLLGRSIYVDVNPGTADEQRVLSIPNYDFDRQGAVPLPEPVQLSVGDKVRVTCTHDQTLRGKLPGVPAEPQYVLWGEGTTDEMCLGVLVSGKS